MMELKTVGELSVVHMALVDLIESENHTDFESVIIARLLERCEEALKEQLLT
jgi:hypothetical protein